MTKAIVFGCTGKSGKAILEMALHQQKNMSVSVFVRSPEKIPEKFRDRLRIIKGDVLDRALVREAVEGHDVVISALGRGMNLGPTTLISTGTQNIVQGMQYSKVRKLLVVSVSTELPGEPDAPFFLKNVCDDHIRMWDMLKKAEDIDWCGVMVPEIYNLPYTGTHTAAIGKRPGNLLSVVALDMADFIVSCAADEEKWNKYKNEMVGVTSTIPYSTLLFTEQAKLMGGMAACFVGLIGLVAYGLSKLLF